MMEYPQKFIEMLDAMPGMDGVAQAMASEASPVSVRYNLEKGDVKMTDGCKRVPWEPAGVYLSERPAFTLDPALHTGAYYVQDASSMAIGQAIRSVRDMLPQQVCMLDACAAPGGKTTAAMSAIGTGGYVVANEYEGDRVGALVENLERWGYPGFAVTRGDARKLYAVGEMFDLVLADVPCSGEGMMRKNPVAVSQWSPALIEDCAALQREILLSVWKTLKPGGFMVYSTCTYNRVENEGNAEWIAETLGGEPVNAGLTDFPGVLPGIGTDLPCARFVPGKVKGEGQFIAVFRKPEDGIPGEKPRKVPKIKTVPVPGWLEDGYTGVEGKNGEVYAIPLRWVHEFSVVKAHLNVLIPGIHVSNVKGKGIAPAHALSTSTALHRGVFPEVELDEMQAVEFMRGNAMTLGSDVPRGYVLLTYGGKGLGFVNNIGSRANSLLPANRRIRK